MYVVQVTTVVNEVYRVQWFAGLSVDKYDMTFRVMLSTDKPVVVNDAQIHNVLSAIRSNPVATEYQVYRLEVMPESIWRKPSDKCSVRVTPARRPMEDALPAIDE